MRQSLNDADVTLGILNVALQAKAAALLLKILTLRS
jgi:hypothetical protein